MKISIETKNAPAPIGPYSQAVLSGNTLYTSGQIAFIPETGELVKSSIEAETHQVMKNMSAVLAKANMTFDHVVKSSIYISNMDDFSRINAVYAEYFTANYPARETLEVARLPKDMNVEISMIAVKQ